MRLGLVHEFWICPLFFGSFCGFSKRGAWAFRLGWETGIPFDSCCPSLLITDRRFTITVYIFVVCESDPLTAIRFLSSFDISRLHMYLTYPRQDASTRIAQCTWDVNAPQQARSNNSLQSERTSSLPTCECGKAHLKSALISPTCRLLSDSTRLSPALKIR